MTAEEIARYVVAYAVWAPSVHNTQPWRFTSSGQRISLHADADRRLIVADPDGREMMISCGAALFNVRLALRSLGYIPETCVLPDPDQPTLVARVSWRQRAAADEFERRLFGCVLTRRTHRGAFDPEPLPPDTLAALRTGAARGLPTLSTATSARAAGVAGLLTTAADRPVDWVNAGQALQRILLTASTSGAAVALHTQPLELPWLREFIRIQLSDGAYPHLVLRIGLVTQVPVSVRREPDDVLFSTSRSDGLERDRPG